jgi:hypothetical protein
VARKILRRGGPVRRPQIIPQFSVGTPQIPTGLTATAVSTSQINLAWNPSSDPGGPGLKDYGVYRVGTGLLGYTTNLTFSDTGLSPSTPYTYFVTARDLSLIESGASGFASATTQGSGQLVHGQSFTITGSGFGTKANGYANPYTQTLVYDNSSHGQALSVRWDGVVNSGEPIPADNFAYRVNGFRGINAPSLRDTGFMMGNISSGSLGFFGNNVAVSHTTARPTPPGGAAPYMYYATWYEYVDTTWVNGTGNPADPSQDGNFKNWNMGIAALYDTLGPGVDNYLTGNLNALTGSGNQYKGIAISATPPASSG